jgi:cytochrome c oxidase subunit II
MVTMRKPARLLPAGMVMLVTGCTGPLSALDPAGPAAAPVTMIWLVMFWASIASLLVVVALAIYAALAHSERRVQAPNRLLIIGGGIVWPGIVVIVLLGWGIHTGHTLLTVPSEERAFRVEVTGHQWWWEVRYPETPGGETLYDANEIHIPTGRPVDVHVTSADVIHSFWVPRLGGKTDAIPGLSNVIRLVADAPGVYRGQCAEFCGAQHARMGFVVVAHAQEVLEERMAEMSGTAPEPATLERPGGQLFTAVCAECHSFDMRRGEPAVGPNLARVAERSHIGAGWIANDETALRRWLRHHQTLKPGNMMPEMGHLSDEAVEQVVEFLEAIP